MLVRDTTHRLSALSIDYGMVGRRMGMLRTAGGLVYLAFCPDNERKVILDLLAQSDDPEDQEARETQRARRTCSRRSAPRATRRRNASSIPRRRAFPCRSCVGPTCPWLHVADLDRLGADHERRREEDCCRRCRHHDDKAGARKASGVGSARRLSDQPGQTCGNHSEMIGNSVSSASNTQIGNDERHDPAIDRADRDLRRESVQNKHDDPDRRDDHAQFDDHDIDDAPPHRRPFPA